MTPLGIFSARFPLRVTLRTFEFRLVTKLWPFSAGLKQFCGDLRVNGRWCICTRLYPSISYSSYSSLGMYHFSWGPRGAGPATTAQPTPQTAHRKVGGWEAPKTNPQNVWKNPLGLEKHVFFFGWMLFCSRLSLPFISVFLSNSLSLTTPLQHSTCLGWCCRLERTWRRTRRSQKNWKTQRFGCRQL